MKIRFFFILSSFLLFVNSYSQEKTKDLLEGNKLYNAYAYFNAIDVYEKVAHKGFKSVELFEKLGNANFFNGLYIDANIWYTQLFALNQEVESIYYYRYSQTLKAVGEFARANDYLQKFSQMNSRNSISLQYANNKNYLDDMSKKANRYSIEDTDINSVFSDYGASFYNGNLIFTSTRVAEHSEGKIDSWTKEYYASLYSATVSQEGKLSNVVPFSKEIDTKYHESTPVFSKDGTTMYFTQSDYLGRNKKLGLTRNMLLKIYRATFKNGKWGNVTALSINGDLYNCMHPSLSADEKTLYFSSDKPGGYGESDLYKVSLIGEDTYDDAENLGSNINTQGKETFPFVSDKNKLYFASDGHLGLGGLDLFVTDIEGGKFSNTVSNLGKPINSSFDDFCYFKLSNSNVGFFSSNRIGGQGKDDIYRFVEQKETENIVRLQNLAIVDKDTQESIAGSVVTLYDSNHTLLTTIEADKDGKYSIDLKDSKGSVFYVEVKSPAYGTQEMMFEVNNGLIENKVFELPKKLQALIDGSDLSKLFMNPVLFDLDKYAITKQAEVELQKVIEFMNQYPDIAVGIRTHTDSRGSAAYNIKLTNQRAKSIMHYLVENGISKKRLSTKALGESQLLNNCSDGVPCTEDEHKINRRCEFIVNKK